MKPQRITVRYEGRVQGVGFRFTCVNLAQDFKVAGYVKNQFDGSVELVAEGDEDQLLGFLNSIRQSNLGRYIIDENIRQTPATGQFGDKFNVKYV